MLPAPPLRNRLRRIDGLRALAILGVICAHVYNHFPSSVPLPALGRYGPQLFFLISGYILAHVASKPDYTPRSFYIRRFFRLAPLYYGVLAGCYLVGFNERLEPGLNTMPLDWRNALWHLTFLHGLHPDYIRSVFGVMWSLTPEVVFYLLFPLLFRLGARALIVAFGGCLLLAKWAGPIGGLAYDQTSAAFHVWVVLSPLMNMFLFVFGMLVHRYESHFSGTLWRWIGLLGAAGFLASDLRGPGIDQLHSFMRSVFSIHHIGYLMLAFPLLLTTTWKPVQRALDCAAAVSIGQLSYSAFFVHYAIVLLLAATSLELPFALALVVVVLPPTLVLSWASFRFIERPGIRVGARLSNPSLRRPLPRRHGERTAGSVQED